MPTVPCPATTSGSLLVHRHRTTAARFLERERRLRRTDAVQDDLGPNTRVCSAASVARHDVRQDAEALAVMATAGHDACETAITPRRSDTELEAIQCTAL
jgi:hypothetical protein